MTSRQVRIAIISDIHFGADCGTKCGSKGRELFAAFAEWVDRIGADLCIDLGDRISDVDRETDRELMRQVFSWFALLKVPCVHLLGNHDLAELSVEENAQLLGVPLASHSRVISGIRFVFWHVDSNLRQVEGFHARAEDLVWLESELARSAEPAIIFTHVPLGNGSFVGNFYFERAYAHHACYPPEQGVAIRDIIERSGRVLACINGHAHWNAYQCIDGVHYITVPSLTETFPTFPQLCESWSLLTVSHERLRLEVLGNLPITYELPLRREHGRHWINMHKDYSPRVMTPK